MALFFSANLSAHEEMEAKKLDNPQWQRVVFVACHAGKAGKPVASPNDNYHCLFPDKGIF